MSKHIINAGATSQRFYIYLQDSTTGQGETGVTSATCYYLRDSVSGAMPAAVTLTFGAVFASPGTYPAWTSGQVREIGYMPGIYLIDIPDAVFAAGARNVVVQIVPTTGTPWLPVNLEFTLSAVSLFDSVRMGMTALPNFTAGAIGGLPLSVNAAGGVNTVQLGGTAQTGRDIGASVLLSSGTGAGQVNLSTGRIGINWADVINPTTALALTNTTISTSQQVDSVSGSVGSVTGNVSGNVVGSVGSVTARVTANTDQWNGTTVTGMPMPTYTQPTGFLAASFPTTVASPTNITAGTITTVSGNVNGSVNSVTSAVTVGTINANAINAAAIATDAIDADAIANSAITVRLDTDAVPSEARLVTGTVASDVYNALLSSYTLPNTFGSRLVRTRSTSPSNETFITGSNHIAADVHELQPAVITNADFSAGAIDANALSADACAEIADALLNRNIATGSSTGRTVKDVMKLLRNRVTVSATTLTVYEADGTTVAWTATVASDPTAQPIIGITP